MALFLLMATPESPLFLLKLAATFIVLWVLRVALPSWIRWPAPGPVSYGGPDLEGIAAPHPSQSWFSWPRPSAVKTTAAMTFGLCLPFITAHWLPLWLPIIGTCVSFQAAPSPFALVKRFKRGASPSSHSHAERPSSALPTVPSDEPLIPPLQRPVRPRRASNPKSNSGAHSSPRLHIRTSPGHGSKSSTKGVPYRDLGAPLNDPRPSALGPIPPSPRLHRPPAPMAPDAPAAQLKSEARTGLAGLGTVPAAAGEVLPGEGGALTAGGDRDGPSAGASALGSGEAGWRTERPPSLDLGYDEDEIDYVPLYGSPDVRAFSFRGDLSTIDVCSAGSEAIREALGFRQGDFLLFLPDADPDAT